MTEHRSGFSQFGKTAAYPRRNGAGRARHLGDLVVRVRQ